MYDNVIKSDLDHYANEKETLTTRLTWHRVFSFSLPSDETEKSLLN